MDNNHTDDYVIVLEDRTEVKNEAEVGKLSVVSNIDEKGMLKTSPAEEVNQGNFLKFNSRDGFLKNFMENFLKQFNKPKHWGLYKVLADNVGQGIENLKTMLQNKQNPDNQQKIKDIQLDFEDYLPQQKNATAINPERVDWKMLETLGLSKEKLEQSGELDFPYMGHKFSNEEKETLLATGNLGKTIEVMPKNGEPFSAYISIDPQTNELIALRADRISIPRKLKALRFLMGSIKTSLKAKP